MNASELLTDGSIALRAVVRPSSGLAAVAERPRALVALLLATAMSVAAAAVAVPRTDYGPGRVEGEQRSDGPPAAEPTEFEREQAAATARKLGELGGWAGAVAQPALAAVLAACALALGFRLAGARASFAPALAVAAHGMLPVWLARLLAIPAVLVHAPVAAADVPGLLPSSAAALLPTGAPPALAGALGALDLFTLGAVWLVALGMARITGATRPRALGTTLILYLAFVAVFRVALPAVLVGGGGPGPAH